jgi:anthranilate synthase/aminodeoxychorismate synthase-like glutamine amidotransferase
LNSRLRVLLVENDDSFTWNVVESLPVDRAGVQLRPGREVAADPAAIEAADIVVVGPGPTDPARAGIVEVVLEAARLGRPFLGICLGHQALGLAHGARIIRVPPVHGKQTTVAFTPSRLFPGIAGRETVMRYNSLALAQVAAPLRVIARDEEGVPMAIEHATLPMAGLQFHPDSFGTPRGREMLARFFEAVA